MHIHVLTRARRLQRVGAGLGLQLEKALTQRLFIQIVRPSDAVNRFALRLRDQPHNLVDTGWGTSELILLRTFLDGTLPPSWNRARSTTLNLSHVVRVITAAILRPDFSQQQAYWSRAEQAHHESCHEDQSSGEQTGVDIGQPSSHCLLPNRSRRA